MPRRRPRWSSATATCASRWVSTPSVTRTVGAGGPGPRGPAGGGRWAWASAPFGPRRWHAAAAPRRPAERTALRRDGVRSRPYRVTPGPRRRSGERPPAGRRVGTKARSRRGTGSGRPGDRSPTFSQRGTLRAAPAGGKWRVPLVLARAVAEEARAPRPGLRALGGRRLDPPRAARRRRRGAGRRPSGDPGRPDLFGDATAATDALHALATELLAQGVLAHRPDKNGRPAFGEKLKRVVFRGAAGELPLDLFAVTPPAQWGVIFTVRTGPGAFSTRLVTARRYGGRDAGGLPGARRRLVGRRAPRGDAGGGGPLRRPGVALAAPRAAHRHRAPRPARGRLGLARPGRPRRRRHRGRRGERPHRPPRRFPRSRRRRASPARRRATRSSSTCGCSGAPRTPSAPTAGRSRASSPTRPSRASPSAR